MNALEFANRWYEGAPVSEETERRIRSLATGIDLHFVTKQMYQEKCTQLCHEQRALTMLLSGQVESRDNNYECK